MPTWTVEQEKALLDMIKENRPIEEIAETLRRSVDAVATKAKRMGLVIPERCRGKISENKVTINATTTTKPIKLKPVKLKDLPSPNEAMGFLWAAVKRLQQSDVTREEVKKLRLIISAVKSYIHLDADYVFRIRKVEQQMLTMFKTEVARAGDISSLAKNTSPGHFFTDFNYFFRDVC